MNRKKLKPHTSCASLFYTDSAIDVAATEWGGKFRSILQKGSGSFKKPVYVFSITLLQNEMGILKWKPLTNLFIIDTSTMPREMKL